MLKIIKNPDHTKYQNITKAVRENQGYCPCYIRKTADTKCMCKEFRTQSHEGECHCGRFLKVEVSE